MGQRGGDGTHEATPQSSGGGGGEVTWKCSRKRLEKVEGCVPVLTGGEVKSPEGRSVGVLLGRSRFCRLSFGPSDLVFGHIPTLGFVFKRR